MRRTIEPKKKHYSCNLLCTSVCIGIPYESTCFASPLSSYYPHLAFDFSFFLSTPGFLQLFICVASKKPKFKIFPPSNKFATNTRDLTRGGGGTSTNTLLLLLVDRSHLYYTPFFTAPSCCVAFFPQTLVVVFRTLHTTLLLPLLGTEFYRCADSDLAERK